MGAVGVNIAILLDNQILLTKREDFEVWCMPGGTVELYESVAQAAGREALEETGLTVTLTRLVGIYSQPQWIGGGHHSVVFAATPTSGELCLCPGETLEIAYFAWDQLPADLLPWHRPMIADVIRGIGGSTVQCQDLRWPFPTTTTRREIYAERDRSGLARSEFFWQMMGGRDRVITSLSELRGDGYERGR